MTLIEDEPAWIDAARFVTKLWRHSGTRSTLFILACTGVLTSAALHTGTYYTPTPDVVVYTLIYSLWLTLCLPWLVKHLDQKTLLLVLGVILRLFAAEAGVLAWGLIRGHGHFLQRAIRLKPLLEPSLMWLAEAGNNLRYGVIVSSVVVAAVSSSSDLVSQYITRNKGAANTSINKHTQFATAASTATNQELFTGQKYEVPRADVRETTHIQSKSSCKPSVEGGLNPTSCYVDQADKPSTQVDSGFINTQRNKAPCCCCQIPNRLEEAHNKTVPGGPEKDSMFAAKRATSTKVNSPTTDKHRSTFSITHQRQARHSLGADKTGRSSSKSPEPSPSKSKPSLRAKFDIKTMQNRQPQTRAATIKLKSSGSSQNSSPVRHTTPDKPTYDKKPREIVWSNPDKKPREIIWTNLDDGDRVRTSNNRSKVTDGGGDSDADDGMSMSSSDSRSVGLSSAKAGTKASSSPYTATSFFESEFEVSPRRSIKDYKVKKLP